MLKPHIVILGAGFGGVYVARKLAPYVKKGEIDVTIVNKTNYFLFTPLLHEVATGGLSPRSVAEPLREIFAGTGVNIAQGTVEYVNAEKRMVGIANTIDKCAIPYDYLVIATGAETNYYGIPGAERFSYPLKTVMDAANIRSRIIDCFEQAMLAKDRSERMNLLSFAVVGGGATGVELAAELAEFVKGIVKRYYDATDDMRPEEPCVTVVHAGTELLEMFAPSLRSAAASRLLDNGVTLQMASTVTSVTKDGLVLAGGMTVPASTVIWTAGVKPSIPHFEGQAPASEKGRLSIDGYFRLKGDERIFALGDVAGYKDVHKDEDEATARPLPMLAQVAVAQAKTVARNLMASIDGKKLKDFHYHSKGSMVSVGQWFAIGEIFAFKIAGKLSWWIWRTVYLFKFASWQKRIRIVFDWTFDIFYPRDITKLV